MDYLESESHLIAGYLLDVEIAGVDEPLDGGWDSVGFDDCDSISLGRIYQLDIGHAIVVFARFYHLLNVYIYIGH